MNITQELILETKSLKKKMKHAERMKRYRERKKIEEALGLELRRNIIEPEYRIRNLLDLCVERLKEPENINSNLVLPNYIKEPDYSVTKS